MGGMGIRDENGRLSADGQFANGACSRSADDKIGELIVGGHVFEKRTHHGVKAFFLITPRDGFHIPSPCLVIDLQGISDPSELIQGSCHGFVDPMGPCASPEDQEREASFLLSPDGFLSCLQGGQDLFSHRIPVTNVLLSGNIVFVSSKETKKRWLNHLSRRFVIPGTMFCS